MKPFTYYSKLVNVVFDKGIAGDWSLKVLVGLRAFKPGKQLFSKGAGYIGGATFYVCWKCVDHKSMYRPRRKLQIGVTQNANRVPWTRH